MLSAFTSLHITFRPYVVDTRHLICIGENCIFFACYLAVHPAQRTFPFTWHVKILQIEEKNATNNCKTRIYLRLQQWQKMCALNSLPTVFFSRTFLSAFPWNVQQVAQKPFRALCLRQFTHNFWFYFYSTNRRQPMWKVSHGFICVGTFGMQKSDLVALYFQNRSKRNAK